MADDFAALKKLGSLSLRNSAKAVESKTCISSSSYVGSIVASKNKESGPSETTDAFDYYQNSYQRYMALHGGVLDKNEDDDTDDMVSDNEEGSQNSESMGVAKTKSVIGGSVQGPNLALDLSGIDSKACFTNSMVDKGRTGVEHDVFAAAYKHHMQLDMQVPEEPLHLIQSVGAVHRAYKQREKEEESLLKKRHAKKIVKIVQNVHNASGTGLGGQVVRKDPSTVARSKERDSKAALMYGKKNTNLDFGTSTISSLADEDAVLCELSPGFPSLHNLGTMLPETAKMRTDTQALTSSHISNATDPSVLVDNLDYSKFSCDTTIRAEILDRVRRILLSGTRVLLRTISGGDTLDGKMLLRTISNHHATITESQFIVPPIRATSDGRCLEVELRPKKLF